MALRRAYTWYSEGFGLHVRGDREEEENTGTITITVDDSESHTDPGRRRGQVRL